MFCFNDFDPKMFRFLRILICLFLVLCILVNCSPLRARATSVALPFVGASVAVSAPVVIGAVVIACGLYLASDAGSAAFNNLVSSISDGLDSAYTYVSEAGEKFVKCLSIDDHYYIPSSLASDVLSSVQSSTNVSSELTVPNISDYIQNDFSLLSAFAIFLDNVSLYDYYAVVYDDRYPGIYLFYVCNSPIVVDESGYTKPSAGTFKIYEVSSTEVSVKSGYASYLHPLANILSFGPFGKSYSSAVSGLSADIGQNLEDEKYKTWVQDPVISINFGVGFEPDPEDPTEPSQPDPIRIPCFPIQIPNDPSKFPSLTPPDVQEGGVSVLDPDDYIDLDTKVELDQDSVPDDFKNPSGGSGGTTGNFPTSGTITNSGNIDPGNFNVDLTQFFPFCIPFDLYKMLACLDAEPVAPEFKFAIPLPGGNIYEFEIELSAWDNVAAMVRMFVVAIFCIGLTMATRKFIKW